MSRNLEIVKLAILEVGLEDWSHVPDALVAARQAIAGDRWLDGFPDNFDERGPWLAAREREALPLVIEAVRQLVRDGLVEVGEIVDNSFSTWSGNLDGIDRAIDRAAENATFPVLVSEMFWMRNTPRGDEFIEGLLAALPGAEDNSEDRNFTVSTTAALRDR